MVMDSYDFIGAVSFFGMDYAVKKRMLSNFHRKEIEYGSGSKKIQWSLPCT